MTAADALARVLRDNWSTTTAGRDTAVPDVVRDSSSDPSTDPDDGTGVLIFTTNAKLRERTSTHDIVHVKYVNQETPDSGRKAEQVVDLVHVEIRISDRDIDDDGLREAVAPRMVGSRNADNEREDYGGLRGEVRRVLDANVRYGFKEWDKAPYSVDLLDIQNTDARCVIAVELTVIEQNVKAA